MGQVRRLFNAVLRNMWLIIILSAVGGYIAWYVNIYFNTTIYVAETTVYAFNRSKATLSGGGLNYQDIMVSRQLVQDYSEIIHSRKVTSLAINELKDMKLSEEMLKSMTSIDLKKDSSVMSIRAVSSDPTLSAAVANAMSQAFVVQIRTMINSDIVGVLDEAKVPGASLPANNTRDIVIGILAGMAIALAIVYIIELFDTTIRDAEEVEHYLKLRVIGIIPKHSIH